MISDEQLISWEAELDNGRYQWHGEMRELIAEVRCYNLLQKQVTEYQKQFADTVENLVQTRREADWLSEKCAMLDDGLSGTNATGYRELARRSVI